MCGKARCVCEGDALMLVLSSLVNSFCFFFVVGDIIVLSYFW